MPTAQYQLGLLYQKGLGVQSDMKAAFGWIQKAARQGHVRAQYDLGTLYAEGKGTTRDYPEADDGSRAPAGQASRKPITVSG